MHSAENWSLKNLQKRCARKRPSIPSWRRKFNFQLLWNPIWQMGAWESRVLSQLTRYYCTISSYLSLALLLLSLAPPSQCLRWRSVFKSGDSYFSPSGSWSLIFILLPGYDLLCVSYSTLTPVMTAYRPQPTIIGPITWNKKAFKNMVAHFTKHLFLKWNVKKCFLSRLQWPCTRMVFGFGSSVVQWYVSLVDFHFTIYVWLSM